MKNPRTMNRLLFSIAIFLRVWSLGAQTWQQGYPGTDAFESKVIVTTDGGYLFSNWGSTVATKTDAAGHIEWTVAAPASLNAYYGGSAVAMPDGNYVVVGRGYNTASPPGSLKAFAIKVDLQGNVIWEKIYDNASGGNYSVTVATDGGLFIGGEYNFLMKTDANGDLLWQNPIYYVEELVATADSGVIALAYDYLSSDPKVYVHKVSAAGTLVWSKTYLLASGDDFVARGMAATTDGGFVISGFTNPPNSPASIADMVVQKYDGNGDQQWSQVYQETGTEVGENIAQTPDGGYIVTGWKDGRIVWLWRLDSQGNLAWEKEYFTGEGLSVQPLSDGFILLTRGLRLVRTDLQGHVFDNNIKGSITDDQNYDCQFQTGEPGLAGWTVTATGPLTFITETDTNGLFEMEVDTGDYNLVITPPQFIWQPCQPQQLVSLNTSPLTLDLGELPAQAVAASTSTISGYVYQDLDGDCVQDPDEIGMPNMVVWAATESNLDNPQFFTTTDANGFYSFTLPAGTDYYWVFLGNSPTNPYCQPCNNDWLQYLGIEPLTHNIGVQCQIPAPQLLSGFVFYDENENCQPDFGETGLASWKIEVLNLATQDTFSINGSDFADGHFTVSVDTGQYSLTIVPPNYLFLPCQFVYNVNMNLGGAPTVYIPLMPFAHCPKLTVDVGTWGLRPCFSNTYVVQYCNEGTATADNAYVEVTFPPSLTVDSSAIIGVSLPGNVWQFQLGDIPIDSCGSFWIKTFLDCADTVGQTYCVEAHIYPDSICGPSNPVWDGSTVELSADCVGDSVILTIANAGWGDMSQPLSFIVVEDNVLIRDSTFQLPAGGSTNVTVFPNGTTIVLSAQQAANHPGMSMPIVFVEGCGGDSISLGFVTQYPQNDSDDFISIDCHESVNSCDPNTKAAQPKGVTDRHFIENTTELTYQITFQNLGNAPAVDVVILDTLSQYLDTARLQLGAASFPYTFELLPPNVLKFTFENIQLPAASTDYDGSIGFVKFRVKQRPGNLPGTEIHNRAGIYFDFNAPVITNTVTHRIPAPQMFENQLVNLCAGEEWNGQVFTTDTLLKDTLRFAFFDSIFISNIHVEPLLTASVDTSVVSGSEVFGVVVQTDTVFTQLVFDANGCLARTVTVHLLSDAKPGLENLQTIAIAPNPTSSNFSLSGQLATGAFCEAKILDAYGRTIVQLFDNEWIASGFSRAVSLPSLPSGLYFVSFAMDGERRVMKLVVE